MIHPINLSEICLFNSQQTDQLIESYKLNNASDEAMVSLPAEAITNAAVNESLELPPVVQGAEDK